MSDSSKHALLTLKGLYMVSGWQRDNAQVSTVDGGGVMKK
jgi:hypothetical protein